MNYEDAFRHYREGTATEEEKEFVLEEIAKAKALSNFLEDEGLNVKSAPIKEADKKRSGRRSAGCGSGAPLRGWCPSRCCS